MKPPDVPPDVPPDYTLRHFDIEEMFERFHALGMPDSISLADFTELCSCSAGGTGQLTTAGTLRSLTAHLVGRTQARVTREGIARLRDQHKLENSNRPLDTLPKSRLKKPSSHLKGKAKDEGDLVADPTEHSRSQLESSLRIFNAIKKEYDLLNRQLSDLDGQKRALCLQLTQKRRNLLLLQILEKRETFRGRRLGQFPDTDEFKSVNLRTLIENLRKEARMGEEAFRSVLTFMSSSTKPRSPPLEKNRGREGATTYNYHHTTRTLAQLHSCHIGLHSAASRSQTHPTLAERRNAIEERLITSLQRVGSHDEAALDDMKQRLQALATLKARRRYQYRRPPTTSGSAMITGEGLNGRLQGIREREREVQVKLDRAVALGYLNREYMQKVSQFRTTTAPSQLEALQAETKRVKGYIDVLQEAISADDTEITKASRMSFKRQVQDTLGLAEDTEANLLTKIEKILAQLAELQTRLRNGTDSGMDEGRQENGDVDALIQQSWDRVERLLKRKGEKALHGFRIVGDVKEMLELSKGLR